MKNITLLLVAFILAGQIGCIKKDAIKDHLVGSWDLTNHCHEGGFLLFSSDGTGSLSVFEDCVVGYSCINVLPFDWSVEEKTGLLSVTYDNENTAQFICSEGTSTNSGIYPATETTIVSTTTSIISLQGYAFKER